MNTPWEQHGDRYYLRDGNREYMVSWDSYTGQWAQYARFIGDFNWSVKGFAQTAERAKEL